MRIKADGCGEIEARKIFNFGPVRAGASIPRDLLSACHAEVELKRRFPRLGIDGEEDVTGSSPAQPIPGLRHCNDFEDDGGFPDRRRPFRVVNNPLKFQTRCDCGYIFRGENAGSFCFVPESCVSVDPAGAHHVDAARYFATGWSVRNRRWTDVDEGGSFLFPREDDPVADLAVPGLAQFLARLALTG